MLVMARDVIERAVEVSGREGGREGGRDEGGRERGRDGGRMRLSYTLCASVGYETVCKSSSHRQMRNEAMCT